MNEFGSQLAPKIILRYWNFHHFYQSNIISYSRAYRPYIYIFYICHSVWHINELISQSAVSAFASNLMLRYWNFEILKCFHQSKSVLRDTDIPIAYTCTYILTYFSRLLHFYQSNQIKSNHIPHSWQLIIRLKISAKICINYVPIAATAAPVALITPAATFGIDKSQIKSQKEKKNVRREKWNCVVAYARRKMVAQFACNMDYELCQRPKEGKYCMPSALFPTEVVACSVGS